MAKILVVDDEVGIRELLSEILYDEGHTVEIAENASQARLARQKSRPDLVLLDIWMPDTDGVSLLKEWGSQGLLDMPVIMMSGHATVDTAVEATRIGAMDFLEKPITLQKLLNAVQTALTSSNYKRTSIANAKASNVNTLKAAPEQKFTVPEGPKTEVAKTNEPAERPGYIGKISLTQPLREARDEFERYYFEYHLAQENNSITKVSERTGLERTHLYRKLRQLGIDTARRRNNQ
ncbi:response regulator [Brackiella oedipodis]|uniref:response regulator n=1 Tax=Brackiella oedipodis TaxID=124225 RepID=UPI00048D5D5C|nr:response regulator [Brackiella oedipodis]